MDEENKVIEETTEKQPEAAVEAAAPAEAVAEEITEKTAAEAPEAPAAKNTSYMKILIAVLVAVCIAGAAVIGYMSGSKKTTAETETVQAETEAQAESADAAEDAAVSDAAAYETLDFEAMYAAFSPDDVIATVNGTDVTWAEYYYWLYSNASYIQSYFTQMYMYYGVGTSWSEEIEEGVTYADYSKEVTEAYVIQAIGINSFCSENNIELDEYDLAAIEEDYQSSITDYCGEGATEADLEEYLAANYLPLDYFRSIITLSTKYQKCYNTLYGENAEKVSDEEAIAWLEDNGYMIANHILLLTMDMSTYESLDDETKAEKLAKAQEIAEELKGITDTEELLARFAELKAEFCEDTGKEAYPDGYIFTEGEMVDEFYQGTLALDEYAVSDPIESSYGYHIIMRMPLDPEWQMDESDDGTPVTARMEAADSMFTEAVSDYLETLKIEYKDIFAAFNITDYITAA